MQMPSKLHCLWQAVRLQLATNISCKQTACHKQCSLQLISVACYAHQPAQSAFAKQGSMLMLV